jgi:hypothetical protein
MQENRVQQRSRAGMLFGFLAIAVVVASVIGTLAAMGRFASGGAGLRPGILHHELHIDTVRTAHLYCPSSPSFSPDGSTFAVLGTGTPCTDPQASAPRLKEHKLAIYSVATGKLQHVVELDYLFSKGIIPGCVGVPVRTVQFTGLGWSPDGENFAVLFVGFEYASFDTPDAISPDTEACSGLLLLPMDSTSACPIVCPIPGDSGFFAASSGTYTGYSVWYTGPGQMTSYPPQAVAPALVYGWSANGQPQSESPLTGQTVTSLPTRAGPSYPVGNPSTSSTYSVWQPGLVAGPAVFGGGSASVGDDDVFVTQFATWVPSGQYVTMIVAGVALAPPESQYDTAIEPTPTSPTAVPLTPLPPQLTQVPARDSALVAVQRQVGANGWAMTAWNDAGTVLASINCAQVGSPRLELRDTQTGSEVGSSSLRLPAGDTGCSTYNFSQSLDDYPNPNLSLQWSPVGSHVLLTDQTANLVTIWQVTSA